MAFRATERELRRLDALRSDLFDFIVTTPTRAWPEPPPNFGCLLTLASSADEAEGAVLLDVLGD
jgi:hypothetical protein